MARRERVDVTREIDRFDAEFALQRGKPRIADLGGFVIITHGKTSYIGRLEDAPNSIQKAVTLHEE